MIRLPVCLGLSMNQQHFDMCDSLAISRTDLVKFKTLSCFLAQNPSSLSWRARVVPDLNTLVGLNQLATKYINARNSVVQASIPSTVPDSVVSTILQSFYGYEEKFTTRMQTEHQQSMAAENMVGALLERYIASRIETSGWVWCAGDLVRSVDFIKQDGDSWLLLQIKNRDNSENSSSAAIRNGTTIQKWFRTFSRTGRTNWENFPATDMRRLLSENGFKQFVENYA